jgi:hypothetical protein
VFHFIDRGIDVIERLHDIHNIKNRTIYNDKENIWEWMFQPVHTYTYDELNDPNNRFETVYPNTNYPYPLTHIRDDFVCNAHIYSSSEFPLIRELFHKEINKLIWTPALHAHMEENKKFLKHPDKTMAAFLRCPGQLNIDPDKYQEEIFTKQMDELDSLLNEKGFEYIYLITMVDIFYSKIKERFGDKVITLSNKRYVDIRDDWSKDVTIDYKNECVTCFTEVYLASLCKFVIGGSSNLVLGTLFMNPNVEFKLFDAVKTLNGL